MPFRLCLAITGSNGLHDTCGAFWTSVDASVLVLGDCYASGCISPLSSVAQCIPVVPKGVDSVTGPKKSVEGGFHVQGDHGRGVLTGMGSYSERGIWSTMQGAASQLPRATECFAGADVVSLSPKSVPLSVRMEQYKFPVTQGKVSSGIS